MECQIIFTSLLVINQQSAIPDLVKDIKLASGSWINENKLTPHRFNWQEGYGAFSYRLRDIDEICKYIQNQEEHHHKKTFKEGIY